jgi:hypothetical protein
MPWQCPRQVERDGFRESQWEGLSGFLYRGDVWGERKWSKKPRGKPMEGLSC